VERLGRLLQGRARCLFWVQRPIFIVVKEHGVMTAEEAQAALAALSHEVLRCLGAHHHQEDVLLNKKEEGWAWRSVDAGVRTSASLTRAAMVNGDGGFVRDGFMMAARRTRHLRARGLIVGLQQR
jgi:hypothetical protein